MTKENFFRTRHFIINDHFNSSIASGNRARWYFEYGVIWADLRQLHRHARHNQAQFHYR